MGSKRRNGYCLVFLKLCGYKIYFWSNENNEPLHVHISKGMPTKNATKVWITKMGGCIVANSFSQIPDKESREVLKVISNNYFLIVSAWKSHFRVEDVKFYC